jgi:hypothetical protein
MTVKGIIAEQFLQRGSISVQASGPAASATLESAVKAAVSFTLRSKRGKHIFVLLNLGGTTSLRPMQDGGFYAFAALQSVR